jgi:hypothetical protein
VVPDRTADHAPDRHQRLVDEVRRLDVLDPDDLLLLVDPPHRTVGLLDRGDRLEPVACSVGDGGRFERRLVLGGEKRPREVEAQDLVGRADPLGGDLVGLDGRHQPPGRVVEVGEPLGVPLALGHVGVDGVAVDRQPLLGQRDRAEPERPVVAVCGPPPDRLGEPIARAGAVVDRGRLVVRLRRDDYLVERPSPDLLDRVAERRLEGRVDVPDDGRVAVEGHRGDAVGAVLEQRLDAGLLGHDPPALPALLAVVDADRDAADRADDRELREDHPRLDPALERLEVVDPPGSQCDRADAHDHPHHHAAVGRSAQLRPDEIARGQGDADRENYRERVLQEGKVAWSPLNEDVLDDIVREDSQQ